RERPVVDAIVPEPAGDRQPRAFTARRVVQVDRLRPQVLVRRRPADVQDAAARHRVNLLQAGVRGRLVHLDPAGRHVAGDGRRAAEAVAVGHHQADAEQPFTGQVNVGRATAVGVLAQALPGLALVGRDPDLDLADAAGADLVQAVLDRGPRRVD